MDIKMGSMKDYFIFKGRLENRYQESETDNLNEKCKDCIRKHYSYPDTCHDGWQHMNKSGCKNFKLKR